MGFSPAGGNISGANDVALSNPATGQVLTYNSGLQKWSNAAVSGSSSATGQVIHADSVPAGSGLSNVVANGSTNDRTTLQAQLDYIKATWSAGTLILPSAKVMVITSGLVVPSGVRIMGDRTPVIKYTASSGVAITINDGSRTPLIGFKLFGPASGGPSNIVNQGTTVGIDISGARMEFRELEIRYFYRGVNLVNDDTYINAFESCLFGNSDMCVWADIVGVSGSAAVTNSGERTVFNNCLFDNSTQAIYYSAPGSSLYFTNTSIDYCKKFGTFSDVVIGFSNCHLESSGSTLLSQGSNPRYMFEMLNNAKLTLTNCTIIMGGPTTMMLIQSGTTPVAPSNGYVRLQSVFCYFTDSVGAAKNIKSHALSHIASGTSSFTTYVPWSANWSATTVQFVYNNGRVVPAVTPKITSFSDTTGEIVITFSGPTAADAALLVEYGH